MKINLTQFITKTSRSISLSESERAKMLGTLREYIAMKPVRSEALHNGGTISAWYVFMRRPVAIALIAIFLISGGGISYAAEGALPGDLLYPVKVGVNERVRFALAVTPEQKASVAAERAVTRLNEASALASEGKLTPAAEAELSAAFTDQADIATKRVGALHNTDSSAAITVASDFESELAAHVEILDDVAPKGGREIRRLAVAKARAFSDIRASAESENDVSSGAVAEKAVTPTAFSRGAASSVDVSAEHTNAPENPALGKNTAARMAASSKKALRDIQALFAKIKTKLHADAVAETETVIAGAHADIDTGDSAFATGDYSGAFHDYQNAFVSLKKISIFLKTKFRGGVRIRIEVSTSLSGATPPDASSVPSGISPDFVPSGHDEENFESHAGPGMPPPTIQILPSPESNGPPMKNNSGEHPGLPLPLPLIKN